MTKNWDDQNSTNRPASIQVQLYRQLQNSSEEPVYVGSDTMTPDADGNWNLAFTNLPKADASGIPYVYSIKEIPVEGYYARTTGSMTDGYAITNTQIKKIDIPVKKVWKGKEGTSATITLLANNEEKQTVTITKDDNWEYTFKDLPEKDNDGNDIVYTVKEAEVDGYQTAISGSAADGFTITNTEIKKIDIPVKKVWKGKEGTSVTVTLLANGKEQQTVTITKDDGWKYTFKDLPEKDDDGNDIVYTVKEAEVTDYTSSISGTVKDGFTITNTEIIPKTSVSVKKVWKGGTGDKAVVHLLADGKETASFILTADNNWQHTFSNLDKEKDGKDIVYTIKEDVVSGYDSEITGNAKDGFIVTNTRRPDVPSTSDSTSVSVKKVWKGGIGEKAVIHLFADDKEIASYTLTAEDHWQYTFTNLDKTRDGREIVYTVKEDAVSGYQSEVSGNMKDGFVVTNTLIPTVPSTPSTPAVPPVPKTSKLTPKTGVDSNVTGWIVLAAVAGIGAAAMMIYVIKNCK